MIVEYLQSLDLDMFNIINEYAGKGIFFNDGLIFYAKYYPFLLFFAVVAYDLYSTQDRKRTERFIYQIFFTMILCGFIKYAITLLYFRDRPFINNPVQLVLEAYPFSSSFPSGHALISFAIVGTTFFFHKRLSVVLAFFAIIGGILRIFGGVHYPMDILAGIAGGIAAAIVINRIMKNEEVKRDLEEIMV